MVRVRGRSWRRWSIAALCCYKHGETSRLIYRPRRHRKHKGKGHDSFSWRDYRDLVVRAHIQLGAPIVLVWDNLNIHRAAGMREYAAAHDWLTIVQLPSCTPDLNPVEGIWSLLRRGPLANTAFIDDEHLKRTLRRGLRHVQLRPDLIDGCLAGTGLALPPPPDNNPKRSVTESYQGVCLVEQFPQCRGGGRDGGGEQRRAGCQRCEDGAPVLGAFAEEYGVSSDIEARVHDQELADGAVPVQDGRAVPAGFWGSVGRVLVE